MVTTDPGVIVPKDKGKGKGKEGEGDEGASVILRAPAEAKITFNGVEIGRRGTEDTFNTPPLVRGRAYTYEVTAQMGDNEPVTRTVSVRAGQRTVVDFSDLGPVVPTTGVSARVTVIAPRGTKLTINDAAFTVDGQRTFETPRLTPGQRYFYTVRAELIRDGQTVNETRRVDIQAGRSVTLDLTVPASTLAAGR
jgi:uncharacterized protein (TIGR03000 family)